MLWLMEHLKAVRLEVRQKIKQEGTGAVHYVNQNDMNITDGEANQGDNREELHYAN